MIAAPRIDSSWHLEPGIVFALVIASVWYGAGVHALERRGRNPQVTGRSRVAAYAAAIVSLAVAFLSPLDARADALFSAHMVQHLVLIVIAAPLFVIADPLVPLLWALPRRTRLAFSRWWLRAPVVRGVLRTVSGPFVALVLQTVAIWYWHFPGPYQAALANPALHAAEHASFLGTSLLFWWNVVQPAGSRRSGYATASLLLFAALLQSGALGALLAFARTPWYPAHAASAIAHGTTALADQQLAGLIMWIPMGAVYVVTMAVLFVRWMNAADAMTGDVKPSAARERRARHQRRLRAIAR